MKKLYRKNNKGIPCVWYCEVRGEYSYTIYHGQVGRTPISQMILTTRKAKAEIISKYNAKLKQGYLKLSDIRDDSETSPVEDDMSLITYLTKYLPLDRSTGDGVILPMLAKTFNEKVFDKVPVRTGQYKINGLRCILSAEKIEGDFFKEFKLKFTSREGTVWKSLGVLENILLAIMPKSILNKLAYDNIYLDGELYIPGKSVNEINSAVKNIDNPLNKKLQFWSYDVIADDMLQSSRLGTLYNSKDAEISIFNTLEEHLNNTKPFVIIGGFDIRDLASATFYRNLFISIGFEGLILRDINAEYQQGRRNNTMIKYKATSDGYFEIIDIYLEGTKRDIPLILCKNDINDETFEVHINGTMEYQKSILEHKDEHIGKNLFITFGERSGITNVPFHVKTVKF